MPVCVGEGVWQPRIVYLRLKYLPDTRTVAHVTVAFGGTKFKGMVTMRKIVGLNMAVGIFVGYITISFRKELAVRAVSANEMKPIHVMKKSSVLCYHRLNPPIAYCHWLALFGRYL